MSALLVNETKALQSLQKLKLSAHADITTEKTQQMLTLMSQPKRWQLSGGEVAHVSTAETTRARELLDLGRSTPLDLSLADIFSLGASVYEVCLGRPIAGDQGKWHHIRYVTSAVFVCCGAVVCCRATKHDTDWGLG